MWEGRPTNSILSRSSPYRKITYVMRSISLLRRKRSKDECGYPRVESLYICLGQTKAVRNRLFKEHRHITLYKQGKKFWILNEEFFCLECIRLVYYIVPRTNQATTNQVFLQSISTISISKFNLLFLVHLANVFFTDSNVLFVGCFGSLFPLS